MAGYLASLAFYCPRIASYTISILLNKRILNTVILGKVIPGSNQKAVIAVLENNFASKWASHRLAPTGGLVRQEKTFENYFN
jgi:hypothetical protein